ncbi:glycine-rich RNA-binding protein 10-like [Galendromus occidentalis]|uniref:Glycine-rich RNA-binding protein 10-like n=1 Tax=Galendromus occidentalis TaxID=34638 RepID=A0AAJ7PAR8_9ACAR|nr:glycine-rich RNA-binding protein 10-like [Galendromus occidentalis]
MHTKRLLCLLAFFAAAAQSGLGKRRGGNVGALFAAGLGGSALGLSYGVLLAGQGRGHHGDHHHIYNYGQGGGGGGNEVQIITAGPYSNGYGGYLGGYGYGVPYAG